MAERDPASLAASPPLETAGVVADPTASNGRGQPLLRLEGVRKYFERRSGVLFGGKPEVTKAVDGIDLEIAPGETLALVGESGSGKSTLGRVVLGLIKSDAGDIWFDGTNLARADKRTMFGLRRQMQMVFQDPFSSLNPRKSVYTVIAQPLELHKIVERRDVPQRVHELLDAIGLSPPDLYADRFPHELSGGQRQRVALARALASSPKFVVADEPVASLDVSVRAQVLSLMQETRRRFGVTYLFITHDLGVVRTIADRVAVMYLGRIVEVGLTSDVLDRPQHPYTQALLASTPIADPKLARQRQRMTISGEIPSASKPPPGCSFHPRCPFAMPTCSTIEPRLLPVGDRWSAACHLVNPP